MIEKNNEFGQIASYVAAFKGKYLELFFDIFQIYHLKITHSQNHAIMLYRPWLNSGLFWGYFLAYDHCISEKILLEIHRYIYTTENRYKTQRDNIFKDY